MIAINHALTGSLIGLAVSNPVIAIIAAFSSHFVCDVIPHFGNGRDDSYLRTKRFAIYLLLDALLCGLLVLWLGLSSPLHWQLAAVCAFVAASPDFAWIPDYIRLKRGGQRKINTNAAMRFASKIQWFQQPIGALVEVAWFTGAVALLVAYL